MIAPTRRAILAAAAGAPVAIAVALAMPGYWQVALLWPLAVLVLALGDAVHAAAAPTAEVVAPEDAQIGHPFDIAVTVRFAGRAPARVQVALASDELVAADDQPWAGVAAGSGVAVIAANARRRGTAHLTRVWAGWRGRLGLVRVQRAWPLTIAIPVRTDTRTADERAARLLRRLTMAGDLAQPIRGASGEFETLVEFHAGMDRRTIDWKRSASATKLLARSWAAEQNAQIVFAIDCGRQMCEPVTAGPQALPRLDVVVTAALTAARVALALGDRVALHAFDARPRIASGLVAGPRAWGELSRLAAQIDYSGEETNHTLGLASLSTRLARRALIVLFTEFADVVSAELMLRGAAHLVRTHLLLVVVLRDGELEALRDRAPATPEDIARAVTAAGLLRERAVVLGRLQRMGVHVIETEPDHAPDRIALAYADLKRTHRL